MNKIYKVIWSKVRNCYVAVSEIAKRNGKGGSEVNCDGKAKGNRAVLALALALSVTGGAVFMPQMARAADIVITSGSETINDATHAAEDYYLNGSGITFTVNAGGVVNSISGNSDAAVSGNTVTINGGTVKNADTDWIEYPAGSGNLIGTPNLTGGFSTSDAVSDNHVVIKNATIGVQNPTADGGYSRTGTVSKNSVTVESENPDLYVYGGYSYTGVVGGDTAADGNIVTIKSGEVYYVAGGSSDSGDVKNNKAVIEGGTVVNAVKGGESAGYIDSGAVSSNVVAISGSSTTISGTSYEPGVYGGYSYSGTKAVSDNRVTISDGATVNTTVYGGYVKSGTGAATGNKVDISQTDTEVLTTINGSVYGGYSENGKAGGATAEEGNKVTISSGTVSDYVYGGYVKSGTGAANYNTVDVKDGEVKGVYGGRAYKGAATNNVITINNSKVKYHVSGGNISNWGEKAGSDSNIVNISGDTTEVGGDVFGGYSVDGIVKSNEVTFSGGTMTGNYSNFSIYSGVNGSIYGGITNVGKAGDVTEKKGNKVIITGGKTKAVYGGYANSYSGEAVYNSVDVKDGEVNGNVYGGYIGSMSGIGDANGDANYNSVDISGGTVSYNVYGGYVSGGTGAATGNKVDISQTDTEVLTKIDGNVYGGYSQSGTAGGTGENDGNKVTISGGTVGNEVYGGYVYGSGSAINNSVDISGDSIVSDVYGSFIKSDGNGEAVGNKVVITGENTTIKGRVYGAAVNYSQDVKNNSVKFEANKGSTAYDVYVYGGVALYSSVGAVEENRVEITGGTASYVYGGANGNTSGKAGDVKGNSVTMSGGTVRKNVYGGSSTGTSNVINNTVSLSQTDTEVLTKIDGNVYGGYSESGTAGGAMAGEGNKVTITGGTVGTNVYGGRSNSGVASGNIVTITGGTVSGAVYGGYGNTANGNTVTISGGVVKDKIVGGAPVSGVANNNTVNLKGATDLSSASLAGTSDATDYSGDELHVGGVKGDTTNSNNTNNIWTSSTNNKVKGVRNFETIALHSVAWNTDVAVLEANSVDNIGKLDITGMTIYGSSNAGEKMSLLSSGYDIRSIKLKYNDGEAVSLVNSPVTIGGGAYTDKVIVTDLLKFSGTSADTVSLATDNKAIVYTAGENSVSSATFSGTADWSTSAALYSNTSYMFDTNATANLEGLQFNNTAVTEDPMNKTMTLISGNVKGTVSVQPTDASIAVSLAKSNTTLGGTATGEAAIDADGGNLTYTINNVALNSVAVTAAGDTPDSLPTGWTKGSAVTVNTGATALDRATGATILSSDTAGLFTGATFSGVNDYNDAANNKHAFASDVAKGVTLDGTQQKGIKASDDGKSLVYAVNDTKNVATITLGTVKTDDPRDMSGTDFDFANTTKVDASALKLDVAEPLSISSPVIPLVANATGLTAGVSVDYGEGKTGHSQDVPLTHADTGIVLNATVTGTVSTASGAVNYTVTGGTLNSIALDNWKGTAAGTLPAVITGTGVAVTTGNFTEPTLAAGQSIDIITTTTNNFFGSVTGDKEYKKGEAFDDTKNGVTLSGNKYGGVKTNDTKTTLTYYAESMKVDQVAFGEMAWGTGRAAAAGYDFINVTSVDASDLTFTNPEEATGSMDLLTNASNLTASVTVDYGTGKSAHSQDFDKTLDNKAVISATLTGTVAAAEGKVSYTSAGTSMSKIDLAKWNGSSSSTVPTGWTLASGATIETGGMKAPTVEPGNHIDIVQSNTADFFANATISGGNEYKETSFNETDGGIQFAGTQSKGVTLNEEKNHIIYAAGAKEVDKATVTGTVAWNTGKAYYENTKYAFTDSSETDISGVTFTADTDPLNQSMTLITNAAGTVTEGMPEFTVALSNTSLSATATGTAAIDSGNLKYTVTGVTLDKVSVSGVGSDAVPEGWSVSSNVAVDTDSMTVPTDVAAGEEKAILTASGANAFSEENITGSNAYKESKFTENSEKASDTKKGVTVSGTQGKGVAVGAEGKSLVYKVSKKEADAVTLGAVDWKKGAELFDGSAGYDYQKVTKIDAAAFDVAYADGVLQTIAKGDSMTLLKANETLKAIVDEEKTKAYSFAPVSGVTVDAAVTGRLANSGNNVVFTAAENKAGKLTFGDVEWKNSGALMARPSNIIFAGADVDTSKINFYKEIYLDADQKMTLVSDFGDKVGTITGSKYRVGTAFEGEGEASLSGSDLIFTTKTSAGVSEQTHKAVMAAEVGVATLNVGSDYIGKALESMGDVANVAPDGTTVGAAIGGGRNRYETGSHVNVNSWNAAVAVGAKRELKNGSLEYGVFGEYGKANYTLHSEVGQSDGDTHYAGGGLMAKWTNKHDVYAEASFRLGRMSDSTNDLLRDGAGNAYGYDIHANYYGAHAGVGKIFRYKGGKSLDVYGKYFYTKRDGVEFDAVQHYNLDSVKSSILRIGARYGTTDKKWNWYGGLAYEYEFDGESKGTVKDTAIRAASIKGSSVRGEIGMKMNATKTNPWQVDVSLYGYGGKHRGFGGNVNVAYMF